MQEIKARGKARSYTGGKISKKWKYGYLVGKNWIIGEIVDSSEEYIAPEYWVPIIPETIGFFTGEKDLKGVDLWSGDIVEDSEVQYEIRFGKWNDEFELGGIGFYLYPLSGDTRFVGSLHPDDLKVFTKIGDIHNNPELLTK